MNEKFFEQPNLTNSYFAGLIAADGCIRIPESGQKALILGLIDHAQVEILYKALRLKTKLNYFTPKPQKILNNTKISFCKEQCSLYCTSNKICNDLEKNWNITPRKTYNLKPPNLNNLDLIKAFIIGAIDGDGCIDIDKTRPRIQFISASKEFITWLKTYLSYIACCKEPKTQKVGKSEIFCFSGTSVQTIYEELEHIDVPRMSRKWNKLRNLYG